MNFVERLFAFAERVGQAVKGIDSRVSALESRMEQELNSLSIQIRLSVVQSAFPNLPTEQLNEIDRALRFASEHSSLSVSEILNLLTRRGNVIWDLQHRWGLFQDAAGTTPVTGDDQPIRLVKPWIGSNNLVLDPKHSPITSNQTDGALFPQTIAIARFTRRTDLRFVMAAVTPDLNANEFASEKGVCWLLGDDTNYDFHPAYFNGMLFHEEYATSLANGQIWVNGTQKTNNNVSWPSTPSLIAIKSTALFPASSIAEDRSFSSAPFARTLYGNARFYLISSEVYNTTEIEALNQFVLSYSGLVT